MSDPTHESQEQQERLDAFVRTFAVHSSHPGSKGSKPATWWLLLLETLLDEDLEIGMVRRAIRKAGARFGPDGESCTMLKRESLRRLVTVWPERFQMDANEHVGTIDAGDR